MPDGTTIVNMDNSHVINVTMDELPDELKALVTQAVQQYQDKCLLSFTKNHDKKVIQKTMLPRTILDGQKHPNDAIERAAMAKTISRAMVTTLANHNEVFLRTLTNVLKETMYGALINQTGPAYFNQMISNKQGGAPMANGGQAGGSGQGGSTSQSRDATQNMQHSVQQPMTDNQGVYNTSSSAPKIAPSTQRIIRDTDAMPYQGKVPSGDIPPGYHYVCDYNTWNATPNLGYHGGQNIGTQGILNQ